MPISRESINEAEDKEYSFARLGKDNLDDLALLYAEVYGIPAENNYFRRKYDTAYAGVENVGFIAYDKEDLPVAYYGVIPCFIQSGNEIILAAQSADTMTHPHHRYKGMFVKLSAMTFNLCCELGIKLIFGFPNQNFYNAVINKPGWTTTESMECFAIPVAGLPFESIAAKIGFKKLYSRYGLSVVKKNVIHLDGVANSVVGDGFAGVYRNDEYLHYKTYNASKVIGIGESKIWISLKQGLVIGDMEGVNESNFAAVINEIKQIAKKLGVRQIQFHSSPGTVLHQLFSVNYKPGPSFHVIFQDFGSPVPLKEIKFTFADIDIF